MKYSKRQFHLLVSCGVITVNIQAWSPETLRWGRPPQRFSNEDYYRDFHNEYDTPFQQHLQSPYLDENNFDDDYQWSEQVRQPEYRGFHNEYDIPSEQHLQSPYFYENDFDDNYQWREQERHQDRQREFSYFPQRGSNGVLEDERRDFSQFREEKEWDSEEESFRNSFGGMYQRVPNDILRLPAARSEILERDVSWNVPAILDEASMYLENDSLCVDLLGLPIQLDRPFSESSETVSTNDQRSDQVLKLKFRVEGPLSSGTISLMATEAGIYDIDLKVDESRVGEFQSRALPPLPQTASGSGSPKILEAEIIDRTKE